MRGTRGWVAAAFLALGPAVGTSGAEGPVDREARSPLDSIYGGAFGGSVPDARDLKDRLRTLACLPKAPCKEADEVRKLLFGAEFNNRGLADFIVCLEEDQNEDQNEDQKVYGPVLSHDGKNQPHYRSGALAS